MLPISFKKFSIYSLLLILISCSTTQGIQNGRSAYRFKQYAVAIDLLQNEYTQTKDRTNKAEIAFLIGKSNDALHKYPNALEWYRIAVDLDYGRAALVALGYNFKSLENYVAAVAAFEKAQQDYGRDPITTREMAICKQAKLYVTPDGEDQYTTEVTETTFNSPFADYSPVFYGEQYLLFTSDRESAIGNEKYKWTGNQFSDIFIVDKQGGEAVPFDNQLNSSNNEGTPCFTKDGQQVYFTRCYSTDEESDSYCRLMVSNRIDGSWSDPEVLDFVNPKVNYGHPTLIENDEVLVFTIQTPGGATGYDLYYSVLEDKVWSLPAAMPSSINTQGDEKFASSDGDTLYFSSNYLPGLGGFDMFKTYLLPDNRWSPPYNLKSPFNSGADDFGIVIDRNVAATSTVLETGYFSSSRNFDQGDQIFKYEKLRLEEVDIVDTPVEEKEEKIITVFLAGRVVENLYDSTDYSFTKIIGKKPLSGASVSIAYGDTLIYMGTDDKGRFVQDIPRDIDFTLTTDATEYLSKSTQGTSRNILVEEDVYTHTINVEIDLDRLVTNREIVMDNILYNFDRWDIREDAKPSLNRLAKLLQDNPDLNIELASHTDCQGNRVYNKNLSQKRAQSAVRYLLSVGISPKRLKPVGYGEERLLETCVCDECSEEQHQINRRTTFKIL